MRRWTLITIAVLMAAIIVTGAFQLILAGKDQEFPGPVPGTPLPPTATATA